MEQSEHLLDVARGDAALSHRLTSTLRSLAAGSDDPDLRKSIGEVLSGAKAVREFAGTEAFSRALDAALPQALERLNALSAEEREQLAREAQDALRRAPEPAQSAAGDEDEDEPFGERGSILRSDW
ncbi:hypothetical protein [Rhodococcus daqingensis]|uniref:Uncharacterized protein n=1 Tax=Rhodococcus daqingensis TaxID=2479363 RepID=A0ABW2S527_9NOCA